MVEKTVPRIEVSEQLVARPPRNRWTSEHLFYRCPKKQEPSMQEWCTMSHQLPRPPSDCHRPLPASLIDVVLHISRWACPCSTRKLTHVWTVHIPVISNLTLIAKIFDPAYMSNKSSKFTSPFAFLNISVSHKVAAYLCLQDMNVPHFHGHFLLHKEQDCAHALDRAHRWQRFSHPHPCTKGQGHLSCT